MKTLCIVVNFGEQFQASIIDRDKLRRMDDIDANEDDWTRSDETFDYNKKIDRFVSTTMSAH